MLVVFFYARKYEDANPVFMKWEKRGNFGKSWHFNWGPRPYGENHEYFDFSNVGVCVCVFVCVLGWFSVVHKTNFLKNCLKTHVTINEI